MNRGEKAGHQNMNTWFSILQPTLILIWPALFKVGKKTQINLKSRSNILSIHLTNIPLLSSIDKNKTSNIDPNVTDIKKGNTVTTIHA